MNCLNILNIFLFFSSIYIFLDTFFIDFVWTTGILWQSRWSKTNSWSNSVDHLLARVVINSDIDHKQMYSSWIVISSLFWRCPLELTICSSNPSHCWFWSEIRFYNIVVSLWMAQHLRFILKKPPEVCSHTRYACIWAAFPHRHSSVKCKKL